jgi:hypothetical protein
VAIAYGHSTVEATVRLARQAAVRRLILSHHSPDRTDADLAALASTLKTTRNSKGIEVEIGRESRGARPTGPGASLHSRLQIRCRNPDPALTRVGRRGSAGPSTD